MLWFSQYLNNLTLTLCTIFPFDIFITAIDVGGRAKRRASLKRHRQENALTFLITNKFTETVNFMSPRTEQSYDDGFSEKRAELLKKTTGGG